MKARLSLEHGVGFMLGGVERGIRMGGKAYGTVRTC